MTPFYCLDIETSALPAEKLSEILPEFEPDKRLKDPDKIAADLQAKADAWKGECPLHAHRGQVLAVGVKLHDKEAANLYHGVDERLILGSIRALATEYNDYTIVGHNLLGFDIPFLCRRMFVHGIKPPTQWLDCTPWKASWAFDTMKAWGCGNQNDRISLDNLAWALGVGRKTSSGDKFAALYATDRQKALDYLVKDLELTEQCYLKMR